MPIGELSPDNGALPSKHSPALQIEFVSEGITSYQ
jgi:hypothetical protein